MQNGRVAGQGSEVMSVATTLAESFEDKLYISFVLEKIPPSALSVGSPMVL